MISKQFNRGDMVTFPDHPGVTGTVLEFSGTNGFVTCRWDTGTVTDVFADTVVPLLEARGNKAKSTHG